MEKRYQFVTDYEKWCKKSQLNPNDEDNLIIWWKKVRPLLRGNQEPVDPDAIIKSSLAMYGLAGLPIIEEVKKSFLEDLEASACAFLGTYIFTKYKTDNKDENSDVNDIDEK